MIGWNLKPAQGRIRAMPNPIKCECGDHWFDRTTFVWTVLVSPGDEWLLRKYKWRATGSSLDAACYPASTTYWRKTGKARLYPSIVDYPQVDHINGWGMDNRRSNLRRANYSERKARAGNYSSIYKGVLLRLAGRWEAKINVNCERFYLGVFPNECQAAIAYNVAAAYLHEEYANLNKLPQGIGWDGFPASADD
jgi:hypothetical protein